MKIKRGSTSVRRLIFIADSSSTTGAGLANLTHSTSGLVAYYYAGDLSNEVQITLVTATLGTFASGGFVAVDNTNMPGWYEAGIPDAALDGGNEVCIQYRGAANMVPVNIYIQLDAVDYQTDAFGALKPTTAGRTLDVSAGGEAGIDLANVGSPTTTLTLSGTTIKAVTDAVALPSSAPINITGNITGNLSGSVGSVTGNVGGNVAGSVGSVTGAVTVGTNNDKGNYSLSTAGIQAIWDALTSALTTAGSIGKWIIDNLNTTVSSRATQTSVDAIDDFVDTEVAAIKAVTDKLDTMLELDGLVYRYTTNALEQAPSGGGGGSTDWTSDERTAIRAILGIPTSGTTPTDPTTGILDAIRDLVVVVDTVVDRIEVDTQDIQSRIPASLQDGRIVAYVGVNNDKTGYSLLVAPPTAATIADAVWDEPYNQHTTAGTFGKLLDILRKANYVTEGSVAAGGTPTTTVFRTNLTAATSTYDNQTLLFISGSLEGQSAPIESYSQTNGTMTLGDALTAAPTAGDGFVILPDHVHPLGEIADAVWADTDADDVIRDAVGLASANLDTQLSAALVLQKLAASGATGSVQVTDNGNGTATLVFKDTNGSTTLATVTYNYTTGARTRVS
jgi:hypothetical protein